MVSWVLSDLANRIIFVVRQCPLGPFRSRFAPRHDQWPFICHHHLVILLAVLQQWSFTALSIWLVWHISMLLSSSKSPKQGSCLRSWCIGLWRLGLFAEVRLWRRHPLVEIFFYIDMFKSLHDSTTSFISDFGCIIFFLLSLVLSINSPNATSLHSRCIWEGVLRICVIVLV